MMTRTSEDSRVAAAPLPLPTLQRWVQSKLKSSGDSAFFSWMLSRLAGFYAQMDALGPQLGGRVSEALQQAGVLAEHYRVSLDLSEAPAELLTWIKQATLGQQAAASNDWNAVVAAAADGNQLIDDLLTVQVAELLLDAKQDPDRVKKFLDKQRKRWSLSPLPPHPHAPLQPTGYIHRSVALDAYAALSEAAAGLSEWGQQNEQALRQQVGRAAMVRNQAMSALSATREALRRLEDHWPVPLTLLHSPLRTLETAATELEEDGLRVQISAALQAIQHLQLATDSAPDDRAATETGTESDDPRSPVRKLAAELLARNSEELEPLGLRLQRAADAESEEAYSRELLDCLILSDDRLADAREPERTLLEKARTDLRSLLFDADEPKYQMLGETLVGKPRRNHSQEIDVHPQLVASDAYPSDFIVAVDRPGYGLRLEDGLRVIRRACVRVSE